MPRAVDAFGRDSAQRLRENALKPPAIFKLPGSESANRQGLYRVMVRVVQTCGSRCSVTLTNTRQATGFASRKRAPVDGVLLEPEAVEVGGMDGFRATNRHRTSTFSIGRQGFRAPEEPRKNGYEVVAVSILAHSSRWPILPWSA